MNLFNYFLWFVGFVFALLFGPLSSATPAAAAEPPRPAFVYTEGITRDEFNQQFNQTLCYDYTPIRGAIEKAVASGLVIEREEGRFYGANAGVSWGECPVTVDRAPDLYITSCTDTIGGMKKTYGYSFSRGYVTDTNGILVTYLIHGTQSHPCDASVIDIFDVAAYQNWEAACKQGPVLFPRNGEMYRCDPNPLRYGTP